MIFTIGHGAAGFPKLLDVLRDHGVATIVDVRSQPFSRHAPDFTRRRLEGLCAAAGLGYRWLGSSLGGRPEDPALLTSDARPDREALRRHPGFGAALDTVVEISRGGRVALLCAEAAPEHCHRATLLAPELTAAGHRVIHLRHDGTAVPHQPALQLD